MKKKKGERLRHEGQLFGIAKTFGRLWVETAEGCIAPMRLRVPRAPGVLGLYRRPLTAKTLSPRKSEKNTLAFYRAEANALSTPRVHRCAPGGTSKNLDVAIASGRTNTRRKLGESGSVAPITQFPTVQIPSAVAF